MDSLQSGVIYIIRHASTHLNEENRFRGHANPMLSSKGRAGAAAMRKYLDGKFDLVFSDNYIRTQQTARIVAPGYNIVEDNGLKGWDVGELSGEEKTKQLETIFEKIYVEHPETEIPNGESLASFLRRWKATYNYYLSRMQRTGERILLVSHGSNQGAVMHGFRPVALEDGIVPPIGSVVKIEQGATPQLVTI